MAKTPITYYGGKQSLLKSILPLVPEHNLYTESFAGGAALFFAKERAKVEVINDLNGELVNFYLTLSNNFDALKERVQSTLHSRSMHEHCWYIYNHPQYFSQVDRAWALWVLSKLGFGGQLSSSFGFDKAKNTVVKKLFYAKEAFDLSLKERIEATTIESDDALKIIKRYDTENAFHFVDPPYINSNMGHYSGMFNEDNLKSLLELLGAVKGKFMLTMFPHDLIKLYVDRFGWKIVEIERNITACIKQRRKQQEWLVINY